jgi:hypothetical protein
MSTSTVYFTRMQTTQPPRPRRRPRDTVAQELPCTMEPELDPEEVAVNEIVRQEEVN